MKKKVLLVGKLSEILGSIHDSLNTEYDVQLCSPQINSIDGMIKVLRPTLMVVCTVGIYDMDFDLLGWISQKTMNIPVVFISKKEQFDDIKRFCNTKRFTFLFTPINLDTIFDMCKGILENDPVLIEKSAVVKRKILTIDDSPIVLRYVKTALEHEFEILLATGGEMGIKKAIEAQPDLILLDYEMPGMDGRETFLNLKVEVETEHIPVIFLTSVSDTKKVKDVLELHPAGYVLKPLDAEQLLTKIHKAIG